MKRIFLTSILASISFLNLGFFNQQNIRGILCGSKDFLSFINNNYVPKEIFSNDHQILSNMYEKQPQNVNDDDWYFWNWVIDLNDGQIYKNVNSENQNINIIKPLFRDEGFRYVSKRKGNKIIINIISLDGNKKKDSQEIIDLKKLTNKSSMEEGNFIDKCIYYPISNNTIIYD